MAATTLAPPQTVTTEDIKQAIIALVKENNAEIKQLLSHNIVKVNQQCKRCNNNDDYADAYTHRATAM